MSLCECGCNQNISSLENRFLRGHNRRGCHHSAAAKKILREKNLGKHLAESTKLLLSIKAAQRIQSEETREKIAAANKRKVVTERTRNNMRIARSKQVIPFKDTSIEVLVQTELKRLQIPFQTHKSILGQPDIFIEPNICIFCDGDYWHNLPHVKARGEVVTRGLKAQGYTVLRFWEHEINQNLQSCISSILKEHTREVR